MKRISILVVVLMASSTYTFSQWNPAGATSGSIYYNGGNVGIGTNVPGAKLSFSNVDASSADGITWYNPEPLRYGIYRTPGSWTAPNYQQLKVSWETGIVLAPGTLYGKSYVDVQGGLRINGGGASPINSTGIFQLNYSASAPFSGALIKNSNTSNSAYAEITMYNNIDAFGQFFMTGSNYNLNANVKPNAAGIYTHGNGGISFVVDEPAAPITFATNNIQRMTINPAGNVGIGTNPSAAKLDIFGASNNTTNLILSANYADRYRWRVKTTDRGYSIDMDFTSSDAYDVEEPVLKLSRSNSTRPEFQLYNNTIVANDGNVGIGTPTPTTKLDVAGTINATGFLLNGVPLSAGGGASPWVTSGSNINYNAVGNVGIGTANPSQKLTVNGTIYSREVKVDLSVPGPDYVFEETYNLPSLADTETYIKQNKHLPEVPSACEMEEKGINLSEMNMILLKKVEELTLYLLKQEKTIAEQNERLLKLENKK